MTQYDCDFLLNNQLLDQQGSFVAHQAMDYQRPRPKLRAIPSDSSLVDHRPAIWNMVYDGLSDEWSLIDTRFYIIKIPGGPLCGGAV